MSKELVNYKEGFFTKIKKFFKNLFGKKENLQEETYEELNNFEKNSFRENLEVKQDEEKLKILKLQKEYKEGNISEEDMSDDEYQKLIDLYVKQNAELKEKIEAKKQIIRKKIDDLKVS